MRTETLSHEPVAEWRWQIVQTRNREFDGAFFFAVTSTGIYCKPSCAARRPKRENTSFFATREEAEAAGFRACLRCRPSAENTRGAIAEIVVRACELIENNADGETSLDFLAAALNVSPSHLQRAFKRTLGVSPKEFIGANRLANFKRQVRQMDVTTAAYESGFGSSRALYEKATQNLGMTPATYRKGGKNIRIIFTVTDCSLGKLLVAATEKGVCAVAFGQTEQDLTAGLTREFPAAEIEPDENNLQNYVRAIVEHLDGTRQTLELPLDLQATAFQLRVWAELRRIPYGETRSYKQVAEQMGNTKAVRAVARACATNPVALLTPCHRVVSANGDVNGYRWGVERKKSLLDKEQSARTMRPLPR
jgi:AraC family transcriptional regulator of adaptative response/methylated-DNA-[protein]-cysteine methyltransferase